MSDNRNNYLDTLLLVQESLSAAVADSASISDVLADIFLPILKSAGSEDGRLILNTMSSEEPIAISVSSGQTETTDLLKSLLSEGVEGIVLRTGQPAHVANTQLDTNWLPGLHSPTLLDPWSAICIPIKAAGKLMGALTILIPQPARFSPEDVALASIYAGQIGEAVTAADYKDRMNFAELHNRDIAAMLVHDLQVPLGNVVTSLDMVEQALAANDGASLALMVDTAVRSSQHLQALVDSLMDISRLEAGQEITNIESVEVADLIDFAAEVVTPDFEQRQIELIQELEAPLPPLRANRGMLQRVILNLLDNALKVSKAGQSITIKANADIANAEVRISVLDQGPGIPGPYHELIFERYQQVNNASSSKGLGLGLAFCKRAVEAHGGRIWIEESPDDGACLCFSLPATDPIDAHS